MRIHGISDLFVHECGDFAWDEFLLDDDRIVPHHGSKRLNDHSTLGENNKRCCRELASNSNITGGSATINADHGKKNSGISHLSRTSSLACDSTIPLPRGMKRNDRGLNIGELVEHSIAILNNKATLVEDSHFSFPVSDVHHTGNDIFENAENKDSNDLPYYYGWSEIEDVDDINRMFRSDSTLGLGVCIEDDLSWFSPADDIGASGDALKSDAKFLCLAPSEVKTISLNHDFSNGNSLNNFSMTNAPISYNDYSQTSIKSDSFRSSFTGPDIEYNKDGFITQDQGIGFKSKIQPKISISSHFKSGSAAVISEQQKMIKLQSLSEDSLLERKYEIYDNQGASSANGAEMGSSNMQKCFTMVPYLDDISLEAASFRQLQRVTKQLDLRTKICVRDSLYRLALSAEQRHHNQNINSGFGDERDAIGRASETEGTKRCAGFMDMETNANPIDRSVAHLLFHRPIQHSCQ